MFHYESPFKSADRSEERFAEHMNRRAAERGLPHVHRDLSKWPDADGVADIGMSRWSGK
jgi:hypothetical protein